MIPPAPGLFSTRNGWPSDLVSWSATTRPRMSVAEPGVNGTITFTAFAGYCADAKQETKSKASANARCIAKCSDLAADADVAARGAVFAAVLADERAVAALGAGRAGEDRGLL